MIYCRLVRMIAAETVGKLYNCASGRRGIRADGLKYKRKFTVGTSLAWLISEIERRWWSTSLRIGTTPKTRLRTDRPLAAEAKPVAATARRRLLRTGLIGGPVALLTAGKPVKTLASTYYCSFSGWNSANVASKGKSKGKTLSHTPPTGSCSAGNGPSYYVEKSGSTYKATTYWPSAYSKTVKFSGLFPSGPASSYPTLTAVNILGEHPTSVDALIIAALFSAAAGHGFPYTTSDVQTLWHTYADNSGQDGSTTYSMALLSFLQQLV